MARRMINSAYISSSDMFTEMSHSAQALYIHLMLSADDYGFIGNPKTTARLIGCGKETLNELEKYSFIIWFESGCVVIKHWWCHQSIPEKRIKDTQWQEELSLLTKKDNGAYTLVSKVSANCQQTVDKVLTKCLPNIIKSNLSKSNISIKNIAQNDFERGGVQGEQNEQIDTFSKNDTKVDTVDDTSELVTPFEMFWNDYPRKVGKAKCLNWFKAHKVDTELIADMLNAIEKQKSSEQWIKDSGQYIPHPYTWLNRGGWEDEVDMTIEHSESKPTEVVITKKVEPEQSEEEMRAMLEDIVKGK